MKELELWTSWGKYRKIQKIFCSSRKSSTKTDNDKSERVVTISCKIKFIDSARFMTSSLSNLVDNITEEIHKIKCKDCDLFSWSWKCQRKFNKI